MHITDNDLRVREVYEEADHSDDDDAQQNSNYWMSLFDHRVDEALDEMYNLCMDDDDVVGDDEDKD